MECVLNLNLVVWGCQVQGYVAVLGLGLCSVFSNQESKSTTLNNCMILGGDQRVSVVAAMDVEVFGSTSKSSGKVPE